MSDPIVIDCGGSTRIKRILGAGGFGDMPKLLDVHDLNPAVPSAIVAGTGPLPAGATGSQQQVKGPFTTLNIMFQDSTGMPFVVPVNPFPASFVIASDLGQNVRADFSAVPGGADMILTIFSPTSDPLVEAKQLRVDSPPRKGRRRYVVSNAGPIETVVINDTPPAIFDASNARLRPPVALKAVGPAGGPPGPAAGPPLYVSVVVS